MLNEEEHIERVISGFLESDYPNLIEVLVADGGSTDSTRDIVNELSKKDARIKLIDNPEKYQSFGLNKMIEVAEGEVFLRADGHCIYDENYISESIKTLLQTKAQNVGGSQRYIAKNYTQAAIAIASRSVVGNGGAKYMDNNFEGYADTVFLGCFWVKDLRKLNGFSERNRTNEDAEINLRISEELGGKIYVSPKIKIWYYPRPNFIKLFKQYFRYGRGRSLTASLHKGGIPFRSRGPFILITSLIIFFILDQVFFEKVLGSIYIIIAFLVLIFFEGFRISTNQKKILDNDIWKGKEDQPPGIFISGILVSFVFITIYTGHFLGYLYQLTKQKVFRVKEW